MEKINVSTFKKSILNKGTFKQYYITPYASEETFNSAVVVISSNVDCPTWLTHYKNKLAIILPANKRIYESLKDNIDIVAKMTGVDATFYGLFGMDNNLLFTIQK